MDAINADFCIIYCICVRGSVWEHLVQFPFYIRAQSCSVFLCVCLCIIRNTALCICCTLPQNYFVMHYARNLYIFSQSIFPWWKLFILLFLFLWDSSNCQHTAQSNTITEGFTKPDYAFKFYYGGLCGSHHVQIYEGCFYGNGKEPVPLT